MTYGSTSEHSDSHLISHKGYPRHPISIFVNVSVLNFRKVPVLAIYPAQVAPKGREANRLVCLTSIVNDDAMAACGLLGIFMTQKVPGSLSEVSRNSTKPWNERDRRILGFGQTGKNKNFSSLKLFWDTFE